MGNTRRRNIQSAYGQTEMRMITKESDICSRQLKFNRATTLSTLIAWEGGSQKIWLSLSPSTSTSSLSATIKKLSTTSSSNSSKTRPSTTRRSYTWVQLDAHRASQNQLLRLAPKQALPEPLSPRGQHVSEQFGESWNWEWGYIAADVFLEVQF